MGARKTPPGNPSWGLQHAQLRGISSKLQEPFPPCPPTPSFSQAKSAAKKDIFGSFLLSIYFPVSQHKHFGGGGLKNHIPDIAQPIWMPLVHTTCYFKERWWVGKLSPHQAPLSAMPQIQANVVMTREI